MSVKVAEMVALLTLGEGFTDWPPATTAVLMRAARRHLASALLVAARRELAEADWARDVALAELWAAAERAERLCNAT